MTNSTEFSWESLEIVEIPENEPFNRKFWKEIKWNVDSR